jgi:hypothetical protein
MSASKNLSLEVCGKISLSERHQLKIVILDLESGIRGTFYVYLREIDQAVKCAPYYAKVFRVPDPFGKNSLVQNCTNLSSSQKVVEKSGEKSEKLLTSSLKVAKVSKPSIFSGKRLETRGFEVPNK